MINEIEKQFKANVLEDIVTALKNSQHAFDKDYILADKFISILKSKIKEYRNDKLERSNNATKNIHTK